MEDDKKNDKTLRPSQAQESSAASQDGQPPIVVHKKPKLIAPKQKRVPVEDSKMNLIKIIPVKNVVLFPHGVMPLTAGKEWSNESVEKAIRIGGTIGIVAFKQSDQTDLKSQKDLFQVGTEAKVLKVLRFPDNTQGAVVQGIRRFLVKQFIYGEDSSLSAEVDYFEDETQAGGNMEVLALGKAIKLLVQKAIHLTPNIPNEANLFIENVNDTSYLADIITPYLGVDFLEKQDLLEMRNIEARLRKVHYYLTREIEVLEISQKINSDVKSEVGKQQRKYYVREQMRLLQKELGDLDGKPPTNPNAGDPSELQDRILEKKMPQDAKDAALREVDRMNLMQPGAPEFVVSHNYVNWLLDIPWETYSDSQIDLKKAEDTLNQDHSGLAKVKKRILEFLAVCALKKSLKGPIILFVGPPGVGKTSLGKSVAKALRRKFARISLGGVRDEAEIRGHRRTYIGSMPGKIADALKKVGQMDPVILLDEIDKLAYDGRGDPASALLEVLDPEQNNTFTDHYLNVPMDLSKVFFIATANNLSTIPAPLRDRMEIIELHSYTFEEKSHIALQHLWPQVVEEHGLKDVMDVQFSKDTMLNLIQLYTREAGVRQLKRELSGVARALAKEYVQTHATSTDADKNANANTDTQKSKDLKEAKASKGKKERKIPKKTISTKEVREFLGPQTFTDKKRPPQLPIGVSTGLAWTPNGGDILYIETATSLPGKGAFALTGQLGDVMKESVQTAYAFIKSNPALCSVNTKELGKQDLHIHFPEGAVKKDGPSAGVASFLAIVSQFSKRPIASDWAMTGEISLRGDVLPVGGIKEKLLAAHRYGIKNVLIPFENEKDLEEIPKDVLKEMKVHPVHRLEEVLKLTFGKRK